MSVEYVEKVYNAYSSVYDMTFGAAFKSGRAYVPKLMTFNSGDELLEVGVGTGLSIPSLPRDINITGVDLSAKMLEKAEKRKKQDNWGHVKLMKMDATRLDFPDDGFDSVLAAYFISTVPDPLPVIDEIKRVCKPGGQILFLNHFRQDNNFIGFFEKVLSPIFYRLGFRTDLKVQDLMADANLPIETIESVDFAGNWKAVLCRNPKK